MWPGELKMQWFQNKINFSKYQLKADCFKYRVLYMNFIVKINKNPKTKI